MKLAANISLMFQELPLLERINVAKSLGFQGIEVQFPYSEPPEAWHQALNEAKMPLVLFNLDAGDFMQGGDGLACHPDRSSEFEAALAKAQPYIQALKPEVINILAGRWVSNYKSEDCYHQLVVNLQKACKRWQGLNIKVSCEPINNFDQPRYLSPTADTWIQLATEVQANNFTLQLDLYHAARMQDKPEQLIRDYSAHLGHIQFADCPGRSHPGSGQLKWQAIRKALGDVKYVGWLAAEFPAKITDDFSWIGDFLAP